MVTIMFSTLLILGVQNGFADAQHPVLIHKSVVSNWQPNMTLVTMGKEKQNLNTIGITEYINEFDDKTSWENSLFLPLWLVVAIQLIIIMLVLGFWTAIGLLISTLSKNQIIALIASGFVFGIFVLVKTIVPAAEGTLFDFAVLTEFGKTLSGFNAVTLIQLLTVTVLGTVMVSFLSIWQLKRQTKTQ